MTPPVNMPWSQAFRVAELASRKPTRFTLALDEAALAALAADLGLLEVRKLTFKGELVPKGRHDWELTARLGASVVQACIVTLAPVQTRIDEDVKRRYLAEMPQIEADEVEMPEDDTVEALPQVIDAGAVMAEALALALPLYPRAPGADLGAVQGTPPGAEPIVEEKLRPFAGLADLLKQREGEAEKKKDE
ncbi:YceD family protein [Frigidibacter sp.]|uniref:YceD family protein n=1 Tax=Frigidibacter sp. TaxID=2586418 RepID=UPI0027358978|nr:YceD family protein [Frigidibacter sp.]MDP3342627.1 YceD family protein [Frigidibacter sp.]